MNKYILGYIITSYVLGLVLVIILTYLITRYKRFNHYMTNKFAMQIAFSIILAFSPLTIPYIILYLIYKRLRGELN